MRCAIVQAPFTQPSRLYGPEAFDLLDVEFIVQKARQYVADPPKHAKVSALLGMSGTSHIADWVQDSWREGLTPLHRSREAGDHTVEEVRSYGRGHVLVLTEPGSDIRFRVAVKGSGTGGWARDNLSHLVQENQHRGVLPGSVPDEGGIKDIIGEYRVRATGAATPRTVYISLTDRLYQIGRHWENPYRIWELTSGPFRIGPEVSQTVALLNWPIELRHALAFRAKIRTRAKTALAMSYSKQSTEQMIRASSDRLIDTLARLTADGLGLSAWMFHLANISYSGESTGYDRVVGRNTDTGIFVLGTLGATIESWAAMNWLRAVLGLPLEPIGSWHEKTLDRIGFHDTGCRFLKHLSGGVHLQDNYQSIDGRGASFTYNGLPFVRRHSGDIATYCDAIFRFQSGLSDIFSGAIKTLRDLEKWEAAVDIDALEAIRIAQSVSGQHEHEQRRRYHDKLRANQLLRSCLGPEYARLLSGGS